jgi:GT2 family glycosyltransferase
MHSDVLPMGGSWLGCLHRFHQGTIDAGAIGARLIASDGALQHDGFTFARRNDAWAARSPLKGVDARLLASDVAPKRASAVSGACLLVDRKKFIDVGGLNVHYPCGDYEDVDLCVRLAQAGFTNWILPSATLHHLEGQSRSRLLADAAAGYNAWLFSQRWGATLDAADAAKGDA